MSWLEKLLPPKIQRTDPNERRSVPEGLWVKCPACETVLYNNDLAENLNVCPKCDHHHRIGARERLNAFLDPEGRYEIGQEVVPVDPLKFKDSRKYPERLKDALEATGETDALVVMGGAVMSVPLVVACFEFDFMGGSMGWTGRPSVDGMRTRSVDDLYGARGRKLDPWIQTATTFHWKGAKKTLNITQADPCVSAWPSGCLPEGARRRRF